MCLFYFASINSAGLKICIKVSEWEILQYSRKSNTSEFGLFILKSLYSTAVKIVLLNKLSKNARPQGNQFPADTKWFAHDITQKMTSVFRARFVPFAFKNNLFCGRCMFELPMLLENGYHAWQRIESSMRSISITEGALKFNGCS